MALFHRMCLISAMSGLLTSCLPLVEGAPRESNLEALSVWTIKKFSEIKKLVTIDASTLILLDIDNTLLTPTGDCGTVEHFTHLYKTEMALKCCGVTEAKMAIHDRWINTHNLIKTKVIDDKAHEFINAATQQQAVVLGFTARLPRMKEITLQHLGQHGLVFDRMPGFAFSKTYQIFPPSFLTSSRQTVKMDGFNKVVFDTAVRQADALFIAGVVFCHDLNPKGAVLKDFFKKLILYRKNKGLPEIKKIIFVDDGAYNFTSMQQAATELGLVFQGFHFQYQNDFDAERAAEEEQLLTQRQRQLVS